MNRYSKNFILCGDIDYHCLLCQETFHQIPDIEKHIRWEKHRKIMKEQVYFPKLKKDCIYKIGNYYFCEVCNIITCSFADASEHVKSNGHKECKQSPKPFVETSLAQYESGNVTIKKLKLSKALWNSVVDNKCLLCCVDLKNVEEHLKNPEHVIKLILSETNFENEKFYRKINSTTFHCFTCKKVFTPQTSFENHFSHCKNSDEIDIKGLTAAGKPTLSTAEWMKLHKQLRETLKEYFHFNEMESKATCKRCSKHFEYTINFNDMIMHLKIEHAINNKKAEEANAISESYLKFNRFVDIVDSGKRRSELAKYGKKHSIKLNHNGSKGFCTLCDRYISAHITNFKEHVSGTLHKSYIELKTYKYEEHLYLAVHINTFIKSIKFSNEQRAFWINNEFWVDFASFCLFHPVADKNLKTKCFACDETLDDGKVGVHCLSMAHKENMNAARVTLMPQEFIREIRSNLFHCGFCNLTFPFNTMEKHLTSYKHVFTRVEKLKMTQEVSKTDSVKNSDFHMQLVKFLISGF